jgi:hypothetical protein
MQNFPEKSLDCFASLAMTESDYSGPVPRASMA